MEHFHNEATMVCQVFVEAGFPQDKITLLQGSFHLNYVKYANEKHFPFTNAKRKFRCGRCWKRERDKRGKCNFLPVYQKALEKMEFEEEEKQMRCCLWVSHSHVHVTLLLWAFFSLLFLFLFTI